jgi:hypothetical protein
MAKSLGDVKTHFSIDLIPSMEVHSGYAPPIYRDSMSGAADRPPRKSPVLRLLI